jgi:hypothetical protein
MCIMGFEPTFRSNPRKTMVSMLSIPTAQVRLPIVFTKIIYQLYRRAKKKLTAD